MTIKDELREQFSFLRRQPYENKKEYKRRVLARGQELFDGINCTLEESIRFRALSNCRAEVLIIHIDGKQTILGDISPEEYALKKGKAKDFEKFVDLIFFEHLDEKKFQSEKERLFDEYIRKCNESLLDHYLAYYDSEYDKLLYEENLERTYRPKVKGKGLSKKEENRILNN